MEFTHLIYTCGIFISGKHMRINSIVYIWHMCLCQGHLSCDYLTHKAGVVTMLRTLMPDCKYATCKEVVDMRQWHCHVKEWVRSPIPLLWFRPVLRSAQNCVCILWLYIYIQQIKVFRNPPLFFELATPMIRGWFLVSYESGWIKYQVQNDIRYYPVESYFQYYLVHYKLSLSTAEHHTPQPHP